MQLFVRSAFGNLTLLLENCFGIQPKTPRTLLATGFRVTAQVGGLAPSKRCEFCQQILFGLGHFRNFVFQVSDLVFK